MEVIDPGHLYELAWLDDRGYLQGGRHLIFAKREGEKYPGNVGHHPGTNIQEVLRALIDRVKYLDDQEFDWRNGEVIDHLRAAIWALEFRAAERHDRVLEPSVLDVELRSTCPKCLHIGCGGECHP